MKLKKALTICEIILALCIVSVFAIYIIPYSMGNSNVTAWAKQKDDFKKRLEETAKQMSVAGTLFGHSTNEVFLDNIQKYMRINKKCTSSNLTDCFVPTFKTADGTGVVNTYGLNTGESLGKINNTSTLVGAQFTNGINAIIAYNASCVAPPTDKNFPALACFAVVYDVNGAKQPNQIDKDIQVLNATLSGCSGIVTGDLCVDKDNTNYAVINTCQDSTYDSTLTYNTHCANNNWAGAVKACLDKSMRLPTKTELETLYNNYINDGNTVNMSTEVYWSSTGYIDSSNKWNIDFATGSIANTGKNNTNSARCVK
ncbi:MAG: DUF1566 domain-containing protein [Candidatus Gastranaerophilales bacterium]|nr:DUF1566 domain-containing protein [Candidatus Gastranaerophilales bacterium]